MAAGPRRSRSGARAQEPAAGPAGWAGQGLAAVRIALWVQGAPAAEAVLDVVLAAVVDVDVAVVDVAAAVVEVAEPADGLLGLLEQPPNRVDDTAAAATSPPIIALRSICPSVGSRRSGP